VRPVYFRRREAPPPDYESEYWGTVVDPDGKVRDRLGEREQHIGDVSEELRYLNALPTSRILDVGCGLGFFLSGLDHRHERHGVEVSRFAGEHARTWGTIHVGTLESAEYPSASFDAVVLHHVIEHVADPSALLDEIFRVLGPGGRLVLGTPDFDGAAARHFGDKFRLLHDPTHISLFSCESLQRLVTAHGFVVESVSFPYFETRHFTAANLVRMLDTDTISPPFYGSFMTFYLRKPHLPHLVAAYARLGAVGIQAAMDVEVAGDAALARLRAARHVVIRGSSGIEPLVREMAKQKLGAERVLADEHATNADLCLVIPRTKEEIPSGDRIVIGPREWAESTETSTLLELPSAPGESRLVARLAIAEALFAEIAQAVP
jgi:SAM-dependent methyltransferase